MRQVLNLREFGEMLHRAGNEWGREIIDQCDMIDWSETVAPIMESVCDTLGYSEPDSIKSMGEADDCLQRLGQVLDMQEHKAFHDAPHDHQWDVRFGNGLKALNAIWAERDEVQEILVQFGAIGVDDHETSIADILRVLLL